MERYANKQNLVQLAKAVHDKYSATATTSSAGLMSAEDKAKLDRIQRDGIAALTAKGHAEQFSTTGKNLWPFGDQAFVRNSGTNTRLTFSSPIPAGTYTFSAFVTSTDTDTQNCCVLPHYSTDAYGTPVYITRNARASVTIIATAEIDSIILYASNSNDNGIDDTATFSNIQLELGSTATDYEPYSGAAPSPSPDWPQEIQVTRGRNLLDESTMQDGYLSSSNGTVSSSTALHCSDYIDVSQGAYTVSIIGGTTRDAVRVCGYNLSKGFVSLLVNTVVAEGANFTTTFNVASDMAYVRISFLKSCTQPQLELGSTPQPYVPYGHVGLDTNTTSMYKQGYSLSTNGAEGQSDVFNIIRGSIDEGTQFVLSYVSRGLGNTTTINAYRDDGSFHSNIGTISSTTNATAGNKAFTGTVPIGASEIRVGIRDAFTSSAEIVSTTPIPLPSRGWVGSLPDGTADVLTLDGAGKVEWKLNDDKVVLDGSETWNLASGNKAVGAQLTSAKKPSTQYVSIPSLCDYFKVAAQNTVVAGSIGYAFSQGGGILFNSTGTSMVVADWTTWLSTHPVTVLYPLATPTTELCGYVDMPRISGNCTVSIPELDALGVTYLIGDSVREMAEQYYERARSEYEDRIASLEAAVSEIIAG